MTVRLKPTKCLACGYVADSASSTTDPAARKRPKPGSIAICIACGYLQAYASDLSFRELTVAEKAEVELDPTVLRIQQAMKRSAVQ